MIGDKKSKDSTGLASCALKACRAVAEKCIANVLTDTSIKAR